MLVFNRIISWIFTGSLCVLATVSRAQLIIQTDTLRDPSPLSRSVSGANNNVLTDQLTYIFNADTTHIDSTYFNSDYIDEVGNLHFSLYRFPGGTVGNYFHFYGTGMGFDSLEYNCRPGYFTMPYIKGIQPIDGKVNHNFTRDYVRFIRAVESESTPVSSYILINLHTHIYRKQLQFANPAIRQQLATRFGPVLLGKKLREVDSVAILEATAGLRELLADPAISGIKDSLLQDQQFRYFFSENMAMLRYLREQGISISGVELGNETFNEYLLFDDDLTALGFDCTNAPPNAAKTMDSLRLGDYFEGLLKYWVLSTLYADSVHHAFSLPVGVPAALPYIYILFNSSRQPYVASPFNDLYKQAMLWNGFQFREDRYDAMIPHFYSQRFIDCDTFSGTLRQIEADTLYLVAARLMQAYPNLILEKQLHLLQRFAPARDIWITEWNFNQYSFVSNTFLHNYFIDNVIRKAIDLERTRQFPIRSWCFHSIAGDYFRYAIIKTTSGTSGFEHEKMLPYEVFEMWNKTLAAGVSKLPYTADQFIRQADELIHLDLFVNAAQDSLYLHFSNPTAAAITIDLDSLALFSGTRSLEVSRLVKHIFDAGSPVSNNETCPEVAGSGSDQRYSIEQGYTDDPDSLVFPAYSIGKYTLGLKQSLAAVSTATHAPFIRVFPNPASGVLYVQLPDHGLGHYTYVISDILGRVQQRGTLISETDAVDISGLPSGAYSMSVQAGDSHPGTVIVLIW